MQAHKNAPLYKPYFYYNREHLNQLLILNHTQVPINKYCTIDAYHMNLADLLNRLSINSNYSSQFELWNNAYATSDRVGRGFVDNLIKKYHLKLSGSLNRL